MNCAYDVNNNEYENENIIPACTDPTKMDFITRLTAGIYWLFSTTIMLSMQFQQELLAVLNKDIAPLQRLSRHCMDTVSEFLTKIMISMIVVENSQ